MQAVILAAGLGTRLKPITDTNNKVMVPINNQGKPFLEFLIQKISEQGIKDFIIATSYLHEQIENYFGTGKKYHVNIKYSYHQNILGTGGAIKNAEPFLEETFFVFNGDSYSKLDYTKFYQFHQQNNFIASIALVKKEDASRYGIVETKENRIINFVEKSKETNSGLINAGVYLFNKKVLNLFENNKIISLEQDIFPKIILSQNLGGYIFDDYFIDMGTMADYQKIKIDWQKNII